MTSVIDAAGGQEHFNNVRAFETNVLRSGLFFALKSYPKPVQPTIYVDAKKPRVIFHNLGGHREEANLRWIWTPKKVSKERADGTVLESQDNPRETLFVDHTIQTPWDDLQMLYFNGYAVWNYFIAPYYFTWPGFATREMDPHVENDQTWRVLEVTYPDDFPTHTKIQKYYYDERFQLRRLDYVVDIALGSGAAHYAFDEQAFDGLMIPKLRRVLSDRGGQPTGPSMVLLNFLEVVVRKEKEASKL